jgi:Rap1a immunity proteins
MLATAVLALAMMQSPPNQIPENGRGERLNQACSISLRFTREPPTERTMAQAAESNFCTGYISGFLDMLSITPKPHAICAQGAMMESVVTAYTGYMKRHPEHMGDTMVYGLMESLLENFPCPTDTPPKP